MLPSTQIENPLPLPAIASAAALGAGDAGLLGESPALRQAVTEAVQAARCDADVLILAESGTGKELLARLIHQRSRRATHPFVAVNCAAVPEDLLESEMFGHVRGAFTGAMQSQAGKFALAHGGTLLLDEIAEMPLRLQPKLLRALQEREFYRLGDTHPTRVEVRVIASTNRPLAQMVEQGRFREDLYYRLNVIALGLPPLRERGDDVVLLAEHFAEQYSRPAPAPLMSESFKAALRAHAWPGNVRELANAMRRAVALSQDQVLAVSALCLGDGPARPENAWLRPGQSLREVEKLLLEITLHATAGNRTQAAQLMGVSLRTIRNKIREHGLPPRRMA